MIHQNNHNPLTHFFNLHSAASASGDTAYRSETEMTDEDEEEIDVDDSVNNNQNNNNNHHNSKCLEEHTELDTQKSSPSFTIAAILGLKAAAAAAHSTLSEGGNVHGAGGGGSGGGFKPNYTSTIIHPNHLAAVGQRPFNDVMNLTLNSSVMQSAASNKQQQHHSSYNQQPGFLSGTFQHNHHHHPTGSALQNLQKLHQQHVSNGFRLMNRSSEMSKSKGHSSSMKSKRVRTIFTPEQLERLEAEFERQQYMVGPERLYLAHTLQLTEAQVKVWFQNRRIKWRKHHLELTQQRLAIIRTRQIPGGNESPGATAKQQGGILDEDVTALSTEDSREASV